LLVVTAIAPAWVVAGNIARMEALLICTSVFGFLLLSAGRLWKGVSILAAGVLIHPNGVFFLTAGAVLATLSWRRQGSRPSRSDWALVGVVGLGYLAYGLLAVHNLEHFLTDMRFQFARKKSQSMMNLSSFLQPEVLPVVLGLFGAAIASWLRWGCLRPSLCLAAASCAIPIFANEMWYLVFGDLGLILLLVEWTDIAASTPLGATFAVRPAARFGVRLVHLAVLAAMCGAGLRLLRWKNVTEDPRRLPGEMSWEGMRMQKESCMLESERLTVNQALGRLAATTSNHRVVFDPPGDALLLQPTSGEYTPFFPLFTGEQPDLVAVHLVPQWGCCDDRLARVDALKREKTPLFVHAEAGQVRWIVFSAN
jgi:hypothetical protein